MATTGTIILGLLFVISANAQQAAQQKSSRAASAGLQPWLLGLTAMVVFLFIVFVLLIVNRVWCKKRRNIDEEEERKERVTMNVYDNEALDEDGLENKLKEYEGDQKAKGKWEAAEDEGPKATAM